MAGKYCVNCGTKLQDGFHYCPVCGTQAVIMPVFDETGSIETPVKKEVEKPKVEEPIKEAVNDIPEERKVEETTDLPTFLNRPVITSEDHTIDDDPYALFNTQTNNTPIQPDPYVNEPTQVQNYSIHPPINEKEPQEPPKKKQRIWPLVLLIILLSCILVFLGLFIFKPSVINNGIDFMNETFNTNFEHVRDSEEKKEEPTPTPTSTPTPTPTKTPTPTPTSTPTPTPTPTPIVYTKDEVRDFSMAYFRYFYTDYINCTNNRTMENLSNVTPDVRDYLYERYKQYNEGFIFTTQKIWYDYDSSHTTEENGLFTVSFDAGAYLTYQNGGTKESNPKFHVTMIIDPYKNEYTITKCEVDRNIDTTGHTVIDITNF